MAQSQPQSLRSVREINRPDVFFTVAKVPGTDHYLVGGIEGKVFYMPAVEATPLMKVLADHGRQITSVRVAGDVAISGGYDGRLMWWDLKQGRLVRTVQAHERWMRQMRISPDGKLVASVADDMVCRLWNAETGDLVRELRGHLTQTPVHFISMLYSCAFSPNGRFLATGDRLGHVIIWDATTGEQVSSVDAPILYTWDPVQRLHAMGGVRSLAFSPDSKRLAVGGIGQINNVDTLGGQSTVAVFEWFTQKRLVQFTGANGMVNCLVFHPEGHWLCALGGGNNGLYMFYDLTKRAMILSGSLPMMTHDAVFSDDFTSFFAVGHRKSVLMEIHT
jgi:WD40 repeat protein